MEPASSWSPRPVDHETCLFLAGRGDAPRGVYRPTGYELHFTDARVDRQHLTHLHEIHHKTLNDDTAWGAAMHFAARFPPWSGATFTGLLGACRSIHETFASALSINLASTRHDTLADAMAAYPDYAHFADRLQRVLVDVPDGHRRDFAATGIARFCMNGPILEVMAAGYPEAVLMSALRAVDRPDVRFAMCCSLGRDVVRAGVAAADHAFEAVAGADVEQTGVDAPDAMIDGAWRLWEDTFMRVLLDSHPRLRRLRRPTGDEHLADSIALNALFAADGIVLDLPMASMEDRPVTDAESVQRLLTAVSIPLRPQRWPAVTAVVGDDVSPQEIAALLAGTTGTSPHLEVFTAPAESVLADYDFPEDDRTKIRALDGEEIFAVRAIIDDDGRNTVLHAVIPNVAVYEALVDAWSETGPVTTCVRSSCFVRGGWQTQWLPIVLQHPTVVLVDSGLIGMTGPGRLLGDDEPVWGVYLDLSHPYLRALAWHVDGHPHVMMTIGDDLTIQLIAGQLTDLLGDRLHMTGSDWSAWQPTFGAVTTTLLATTSSIRFATPRPSR